MKILFFSKYARSGASSRYRTYQYIPYLQREGIYCTVAPLFDDSYLSKKYEIGKSSVTAVAHAFFRRLGFLLKARNYDLVVIEKEIFPYFPAWPERFLRMIRVPYAVDYDDALFHQYDEHPNKWIRLILGNKIKNVMRNSVLVSAGNQYLANYAQKAGAANIVIIPTVVDIDRYSSQQARRLRTNPLVIGWIGSPSTAKYLQEVTPALAEVCSGGRARLLVIGSGDIELSDVPFEVVPWSESTETDYLLECDIGIMPLCDSPWERGKCGFKLIQYMACSLPVVASPVGVNTSIVEDGVNGYLANSHEEWVCALNRLLDDHSLRLEHGRAGRHKVENEFSLQVCQSKLSHQLMSCLSKKTG